jgi:Rrf2 family nitric oxide-sensitive transcriptional repressor
MKLSLYTDNTLKVLLYVASHKEHRCTRLEIADYFNLSVEHLRKVIHQLNLWGYLETYSGRKGGIELAKPASKINLGEVISKTEKQITMFDCKRQSCRLLPSCSLNHLLYKAQECFFDELKKHSLEDLLDNKETFSLLRQSI